jgi:hypothetical protein
MWPFKSKPAPQRPSFAVGPYRIDRPIGDTEALVELSAIEYGAKGRNFQGEKIYNAPPVRFLGYTWKLMLGTVDGTIYKVAPYLELADKQQANLIANATLRYCTEQLGEPASQRAGLFAWDTTDGNVSFQAAELTLGLAINLFITSRATRVFRRLR